MSAIEHHLAPKWSALVALLGYAVALFGATTAHLVPPVSIEVLMVFAGGVQLGLAACNRQWDAGASQQGEPACAGGGST